jgi:menaquinone-9 beta-reductase
MMELHDVAIIGASVSGATLAGHLGQNGLSVALVDRENFPRRKACGEGLSDIALRALERLLPDAGTLIESGRPFYSYRIDLGSSSYTFASRHGLQLRGIGVQRFLLDEALASHAAALGNVQTFFGSAVTGIDRSGEYPAVQLADGEVIRAKQLVLADGTNSQNASRLGIPKTSIGRPLWGISFILEGQYEQFKGEVVVLLKDGYEVNCTPVSETRLNVSFLSEKHRVKALQDPELRESLLREASTKTGFTGSPIGEPLQVGPVGCNRRPYTFEDILLVGDVVESLDPIAGMGMTHGILMAERAGQAILSLLQDGVSCEEAFSRYQRESEKMTRPYRGLTQLKASLFRSRLRNFLIPPLSFAHLPDTIRNALSSQLPGHSPARALPLLLLHLIGA